MLQHDWSRQYRADTVAYALNEVQDWFESKWKLESKKERSKMLEQLHLNLSEETMMNYLK